MRFVDQIAPIKSLTLAHKRNSSLAIVLFVSIGGTLHCLHREKKDTNHRRELAIRILIDPIEFGNINRNCDIPNYQTLFRKGRDIFLYHGT